MTQEDLKSAVVVHSVGGISKNNDRLLYFLPSYAYLNYETDDEIKGNLCDVICFHESIGPCYEYQNE